MAGPVYLGGGARDRSGVIAGGTTWALQAGERLFEICTDPFVVGRGNDVDLQLNDANVSRRHAAFRIEDGPAVEDLKSLNGTFVNRQPIVGRALLSVGDRVSIGACQFRVVRGQSGELPAASRITQPMSEPPQSAGTLSALSPREREVFALFAEGLSQREIASNFSVSIKTVETYRTRIGQKLGIRSRAELIKCALAAGVLRAD